jgi:hypothetical protein
MKSILPIQIERRIFLIRGQRVMLDADLAQLYGVETKQLNRAVRRNMERFPQEFMFQLMRDEWKILKCQIGASSLAHGGKHKLPLVFSEHGVAMLSSVLNSPRAIQVNIAIIKTFVRLRDMLAGNAALARKLEDLERKYDQQFKVVFDAIRELMTPPDPPRRRIGFHVEP